MNAMRLGIGERLRCGGGFGPFRPASAEFANLIVTRCRSAPVGESLFAGSVVASYQRTRTTWRADPKSRECAMANKEQKRSTREAKKPKQKKKGIGKKPTQPQA